MEEALRDVDLSDPLTSNSSFRLLSDIELAVLVTKELGYLISKWEMRQSSGKFPGLGIKSLNERVRGVDCLAVNTKCDMWSLLHMAHPLLFQSHVHKFRENEREVFLALSQDVVTTIRSQLSSDDVNPGKLDGRETGNTIMFPKPRDSKSNKVAASHPDYDGIGDLELVVVSCKELDVILTEQFLKPKHKDLPDFADKIRHAINIDSDARHKLSRLNDQRDVFLTDRAVNNFADDQTLSREVYVNICKDIRSILNPDVKRNHSNSSSDPGQNGVGMDERFLISGILVGEHVTSKHIKTIFVLFCVFLLFVVMSVLIYEMTKSK